MTTEVELCKQMIGDGIAHGIIVKNMYCSTYLSTSLVFVSSV